MHSLDSLSVTIFGMTEGEGIITAAYPNNWRHNRGGGGERQIKNQSLIMIVKVSIITLTCLFNVIKDGVEPNKYVLLCS